jgi:hypothetical protein
VPRRDPTSTGVTKSPGLLGVATQPLGTLPFTGVALLQWLALGLMLVLLGSVGRKASRCVVD